MGYLARTLHQLAKLWCNKWPFRIGLYAASAVSASGMCDRGGPLKPQTGKRGGFESSHQLEISNVFDGARAAFESVLVQFPA